MAKIRCLNDVPARNGRALKAYCIKSGQLSDYHETGDHFVGKAPKGTIVFPDREMGDGLWHKVKRMAIAAGIAVIICACILAYNLPLLAGALQ